MVLEKAGVQAFPKHNAPRGGGVSRQGLAGSGGSGDESIHQFGQRLGVAVGV